MKPNLPALASLLIATCLLLVSAFLSSCGPGQAFGSTLTPTLTPTSTSTFTPTSTPTVTPTSTPTATPTSTPTPMLSLQTSLGTLLVSKVEIVPSLPGCTEEYCGRAAEGRKLLCVWLERMDGAELVDVTDFLDQSITLSASDGSSIKLAAAGFQRSLGSYVVFAPFDDAHDFVLHWPDNPPIELGQ